MSRVSCRSTTASRSRAQAGRCRWFPRAILRWRRTASSMSAPAAADRAAPWRSSAAGGSVGLGGVLTGTGASGQGASFSIDAQNFGDFGALNRLLNTGAFSGSRSLRLRGAGDLVVASGSANAITANHVSLEADQGRVIVDGVIDASGVRGGSVILAAADDLILNGTIDARATGAGQGGGSVQLETAQGRMLLNSASSIDVQGGGAERGRCRSGRQRPAARAERNRGGGDERRRRCRAERLDRRQLENHTGGVFRLPEYDRRDLGHRHAGRSVEPDLCRRFAIHEQRGRDHGGARPGFESRLRARAGRRDRCDHAVERHRHAGARYAPGIFTAGDLAPTAASRVC